MSRIKNTNLTIFNDSNEYTFELSNFKDTQEITVSDSKFLYIGFRKPIHTILIDWVEKTSQTGNLVLEKWISGAWASQEAQDDTNNLNKSGFIFTDENENEEKTTVESNELYWWRISTDSATDSVLTLRYVNILFNDFEDLLAQEPMVEQYYPEDPNNDYAKIKSFTLSMIAARNEILKRINQSGNKKYNGTNVRRIDQWDIFDINELRLASTYYSLHKILMNIVDNNNNNFKELADNYYGKFENAFDLFSNDLLTLDLDDDGEIDDSERVESTLTSVRITR